MFDSPRVALYAAAMRADRPFRPYPSLQKLMCRGLIVKVLRGQD